MKAGVAMAFTAIEMLAEASQLNQEIILLLNSEEEIGSPVSRPITETLAQQCGAVYVLEPAQGLAYKTARKGTGNWRITVHGLAAHAGVDFTRGRSAILELARQIEKISAWTDLKHRHHPQRRRHRRRHQIQRHPRRGLGRDRPPRSQTRRRPAHGKALRRPQTHAQSGCTLTIEGGINRPPMERTRGTVKLFRRAQSLATNSARFRLRSSQKPPPAAPPTATSPPPSASPRSTAWAQSAKAPTPPTNPS